MLCAASVRLNVCRIKCWNFEVFCHDEELNTCAAGPCPAFLITAVVRGGKTMENGKVGYLGFLRHRNPLLCAQRALAAHLCQRYNLDAAVLPDPRKPEEWNQWALWPASISNVNVSYDQVSVGDIMPQVMLHLFPESSMMSSSDLNCMSWQLVPMCPKEQNIVQHVDPLL